jgi:hypothetical protein
LLTNATSSNTFWEAVSWLEQPVATMISIGKRHISFIICIICGVWFSHINTVRQIIHFKLCNKKYAVLSVKAA